MQRQLFNLWLKEGNFKAAPEAESKSEHSRQLDHDDKLSLEASCELKAQILTFKTGAHTCGIQQPHPAATAAVAASLHSSHWRHPMHTSSCQQAAQLTANGAAAAAADDSRPKSD